MATRSIEETLTAYVAEQFLGGQAEGLTASTPLLELGLLDSFSVMKLLAYAEQAFSIAVPLEAVVVDDMKDIASLAALVRRQRESAPSPIG